MERLINLTAETASLMVEVAKASLPQGMSDLQLSIIQSLVESQKALAGAMELQARVLDSQCDTPNEQESPPAGTFHNFRRLPAEIRNAIWEMALPDSRVFVPYLDDRGQPALVQYYKPPSLRGVCKESWIVTEKKGVFVFGNEGRHTYGIWFNYSKDIVAWLWGQFDNDWYIPNVENIAIDSGHFSGRTDCIKTLSWVLDMTPDCQKIIVLTRPRPCDSPEDLQGCAVQLFSLSNNDAIWNVGADIPDFWYQSAGHKGR